MYIRITTVTVDLSKEQEILNLIDGQMVPAMSRIPGFRHYIGGLDRAAGHAVAVSIWDDMEHAQGLRAAVGGLFGQFEALGVRFDPPQVFEILREVS